MSGESSRRAISSSEALDRAFGDRARCGACGATVADYRVMALFFHETAVVQAYCRHCYPGATEGDYHASSEGLILDYATFAARYGAPGPPPPPARAVDRLLVTLVRDPALRQLSPANEAFARKRGGPPYPVRAAFTFAGGEKVAMLTVASDGALGGLHGDPEACERARAALAAALRPDAGRPPHAPASARRPPPP